LTGERHRALRADWRAGAHAHAAARLDVVPNVEDHFPDMP